MDRPHSSNPLFDDTEDADNFVTKTHHFALQRAMHQANEALSDRIDQFATDLRQSEARNRDYLNAKLST